MDKQITNSPLLLNWVRTRTM